MITFLRVQLFIVFLAWPVAAPAAPALPADDQAKPDALPTAGPAKPTDNQAKPDALPTAAPAFLDVVTFNLHMDGENHKTVVTTGPGLLRVDEPDDRYSVIYNAETDFYIGLEHGNYTYWEFSWPEVRAAVEASKRGEARLQELNLEGGGSDMVPPAETNSPVDASASVPDNSGYVWRPTTDRKKIAGIDCVRWSGDTVSGEGVEAWCAPGSLSTVRTAMERLRTINDPLALVPVRTIVPSLVFPIYDALVRGGVTPVQITWGGDEDKNQFSLVGTKTREGTLSLFTIPKLYMKTTLITMDGMMIQKNKTP